MAATHLSHEWSTVARMVRHQRRPWVEGDDDFASAGRRIIEVDGGNDEGRRGCRGGTRCCFLDYLTQWAKKTFCWEVSKVGDEQGNLWSWARKRDNLWPNGWWAATTDPIHSHPFQPPPRFSGHRRRRWRRPPPTTSAAPSTPNVSKHAPVSTTQQQKQPQPAGSWSRPSPSTSVTESAVRQQQSAITFTPTAASSSSRDSIPLTVWDQEMSSRMDHIHSVPESKASSATCPLVDIGTKWERINSVRSDYESGD